METKVKNIQNYVDYTKCGEILKPPSKDYHRPYILKCFQCEEIHLLFEAFTLHFEEHCKLLSEEIVTHNDYIPDNNEIASISEHSELDEKIASIIKVEETNISIQTEDPLTEIKSENEEASSNQDDLRTFDLKINGTLSNDAAKHFLKVEDLCESDTVENLENSGEDYQQSSEDDGLSSDEDELKTFKRQKNDLDGGLKSSNFIKNFLETKEHVIAFIEAYKSQTSLWNKNYPYLKTKQERQNSLQKIADELNELHGFSISWNEVKNIIVYLCRKYRKDLKYLKEIKESGKNYTPSWFFENLKFLKPLIEKNQITKLDSHMKDLLPNQIIEILGIYEELPHLWNTELIEYYCKNKVEAAKQEMLQLLKTKLGINITENILEKYIRTINICFSRKALNKKTDKSISGTSEDNMLDDYYKYMLFLKEHVGRFECPECKKSFKNPLYLKIHKNNAHGLEPFPCSQCKKPFKSVTAYTNHAKRHMEDLNYECKECGKKFLYSQELKIHMRRHNEVKPYCCEICGSSFRHIQTFKTHQRRHLKNYLHHCELCGKGYYTKDSYKNHMNSHSNTRNQVCNICGKTFITKHSLRQHVVIHDEIKRFPCKLCGKTFKQKTGVNQHMRTHAIASND